MAVSLQNYDLGMFSVATMERELDTEAEHRGSGSSSEID